MPYCAIQKAKLAFFTLTLSSFDMLDHACPFELLTFGELIFSIRKGINAGFEFDSYRRSHRANGIDKIIGQVALITRWHPLGLVTVNDDSRRIDTALVGVA